MGITTTNYDAAKKKRDEVSERTYDGGSGVGSKSNIERLAENYVNSNYEDFTKGTDYASLAKRYSDQGRQAMDDTLGKVAARTGGLASSYATTASQQAYGDWMGKLEDAARSLYDSQMAEKANKLGVAQNMYDRGYGEWKDQRDFDYGVATDNISYGQYEDSVIDAENEQALADFSNDVFADLSLSEDIEGMTWDDYKTKCENESVEIPYGFDETDFKMMKQGIISERADEGDAVTDWRVGYEPTMDSETTDGQVKSGNFSPNILKNYEYYYGENYVKKTIDETDWQFMENMSLEEKAQKFDMYYAQAIDAWCAYDEEGCWNYIDSLPNDHPLKEYFDYLGAQGSQSKGHGNGIITAINK